VGITFTNQIPLEDYNTRKNTINRAVEENPERLNRQKFLNYLLAQGLGFPGSHNAPFLHGIVLPFADQALYVAESREHNRCYFAA
jgi:hypothetical protein